MMKKPPAKKTTRAFTDEQVGAKKATTIATPKTGRAQRIARDAADRYFDALAAEIPFDEAPGEVDLIEAVISIQGAIREERHARGDANDREDSAFQAGYLLGVEIGRRMGGAR